MHCCGYVSYLSRSIHCGLLDLQHVGSFTSAVDPLQAHLEIRIMFYFPNRHDAVPASPMALNHMETRICDAAVMTYCHSIP